MADTEQKTEPKMAHPVPFFLRMGSVKSCRTTMVRLTREYAAGKVDDSTFRAVIWAMGQLISYWRLEKDLQIEARIEAIEKQLERGGR